MNTPQNLLYKRVRDFLDGVAVATRSKTPSTGSYPVGVLCGAPNLPLVLRVGVAGHLDIPNPEAVRAAARDIFGALTSAVAKICPQFLAALPPRNPDYGWPVFEIRVISSLAAGADQLLASEGLVAGYRLHAVLPFEREAFAADIARNCPEPAWLSVDRYKHLLEMADRVLELDGSVAEPMEAYRGAASLLLSNSDILIVAISRNAKAGPGGTRWLKEEAERTGVPVICIWLEDLPYQTEPIGAEELRKILGRILLPPLSAKPLPDSGEFERFFLFHLSPAYNQRMWDDRWPAADLSPGAHQLLSGKLAPFAVWADHRSSGYSEMTRGGAIVTALLGALAVFLTLMGLFGSIPGILGKVLELVPVLLVATWLVRRSRQHRWRDRWLNYRQVERSLNYAVYLVLQGRPLRLLAPPAHLAAFHKDAWWVNWYLGVVLRYAGFPAAVMDDGYRRQLHGLLSRLVEEQTTFFKAEQAEHEQTNLWLERWYEGCLRGVIGATLLYLVCISISPWAGSMAYEYVKQPATLLAAGLPALAAAFFSIRQYGEYAQQEGRYSGMIAAMEEHGRKLSEAATFADGDALAARTADVMETLLQELYQWRGMLQRKQVEHH